MGGWFSPEMILAKAQKCQDLVKGWSSWTNVCQYPHSSEVYEYIKACDPYSMGRMNFMYLQATSRDDDTWVMESMANQLCKICLGLLATGYYKYPAYSEFGDYMLMCDPLTIIPLCEDLLKRNIVYNEDFVEELKPTLGYYRAVHVFKQKYMEAD